LKRLILAFILTASTAYGEIYTWKDAHGTTHYANSEYDIPERYRAKAKVMDLGIMEKKEGSSPQQNTGPQTNGPVQPNQQQAQPAKPAQPPVVQGPGEQPRGEIGKK